VPSILDVDRGSLDLRMILETRSEHCPVPRPVVFRIGRGMHADEAPTATEVPFKRSLLAVVEDIPGRHQKDDGVVAREVGRREGGRVLGYVDGQPIALCQLTDCAQGRGDRAVPEPSGLREDEDSRRTRGLRHCDSHHDDRQDRESEDRNSTEALHVARVLAVR
jgi:hypothetical protein